MPLSHAVVWIDHTEAHIMSFNKDESEGKHVHSHATHKNLHHKANTVGSGHEAESQAYYHDVAGALAPAREILIVGPSSAKLFLLKHLQKHDPAVAAKVVGVETVDHPSDKQLLAHARHYFLGADRMRGDAGLGAIP
jgi:hypothetical protein